MSLEIGDKVVQIGNGPKVFDLDEANRILPLIHKITEDTDKVVARLSRHLEISNHFDSLLSQKIKKEIDTTIEGWFAKIEKLGGTPKGIWLVDFDFGQGYYCWKYPELEIRHWHLHSEGFLGRKVLGPSLI